ncbi:uncharacterized protein LOC118645675 [Monomorium pharaonis]|uniref:uncharacterized protein LOC118645675 n=1 Tax=Monomorium pharaonis TaxID=307658 RepID=UPI0017466A94|nr:uncharacterized protein LOC118645675 [Monomorium pharaonis]
MRRKLFKSGIGSRQRHNLHGGPGERPSRCPHVNDPDLPVVARIQAHDSRQRPAGWWCRLAPEEAQLTLLQVRLLQVFLRPPLPQVVTHSLKQPPAVGWHLGQRRLADGVQRAAHQEMSRGESPKVVRIVRQGLERPGVEARLYLSQERRHFLEGSPIYDGPGWFEEGAELRVRADKVGATVAVDSPAQTPTRYEAAEDRQEGICCVVAHHLQVNRPGTKTNKHGQERLVRFMAATPAGPELHRASEVHSSAQEVTSRRDSRSGQTAHHRLRGRRPLSGAARTTMNVTSHELSSPGIQYCCWIAASVA